MKADAVIRGYIDQLFRDAGFKPKVIFETTNDNIIFSSVSANFGIALIPKPLGEHASPVKVLRIKDATAASALCLAWLQIKISLPALRTALQITSLRTRHCSMNI